LALDGLPALADRLGGLHRLRRAGLCSSLSRFFAKHGFLHHRRPWHWHADECLECNPMKALAWTAIANGAVAEPSVAMVL